MFHTAKEASFFNLIKQGRDSFSRNGRDYKKDRLLFKSTPGVERPSQTESQPCPSHSTRVKLKK
ncbi:unnamed protein product [Spirodela intermedia]|uniref:Uncharacterized protein n=1 Tax=Spirodela intermedia TaxID=51605 RepID=A0A7I8KB02_SPIIN|nr:unnamed protein product [Spirodela intermedia]